MFKFNEKLLQEEQVTSTNDGMLYGTSTSYPQAEKMRENIHYVQFYNNDAFLINSVKRFLLAGDSALVIATREHRKILDKIFNFYPKDRYISLDAKETLAKFMINDYPDKKKFEAVMSTVLKSLENSDTRIHAFGEMVALLWLEGKSNAAIQLEQLWNDFQQKNSFSLYCAYPMSAFKGNKHTLDFSKMCNCHTNVVPTEQYMQLLSKDERLREIAKLQQHAHSLETEIHKRKQLENQRDEFMSIVSHELKTPTTSLKAYTQILQKRFEKEGHPKTIEYMQKMDKQINKLTNLIEDILDVTKIQGGKLKFRLDRFDFDDLINESIEEIQRTTPSHNIIREGKTNKTFKGDRERIGQVLTNLLTNAIKFSPDSDRIIVKTVIKNKELLVSVQDFGFGIDIVDQPHIFERFYRATGKKQSTYPGLGLGLYISSEIISRHGGTIHFKSTNGKGTTFFFTLPIE